MTKKYEVLLNFVFFEMLKAPLPSKSDLGSGTSESYEIFRICWGYSGEAMVKFSALWHDI
jgi:hypothetical protein